MRRRSPSLALALATLALVASVALASLRLGGLATFVVTGRSMEPAIPVGSLTIVQPVAADAIRVGDVVTYDTAGHVVTHRVVAIDPDGTFTTKGDANAVADPERLSFTGHAGLVRAHVPLVGYAVAGWRQHAQIAAVALLGACVVLALVGLRRRSAHPRRHDARAAPHGVA